MRLRPLLAAFCALLVISVSTPVPAFAQSSLTDLDKALGEQPGGAVAPATPSDDTPIPDAVNPTSPITPPAGVAPAPAPAPAGAAGAVPGPPPYLSPGQSAGVQPIAAVENLTEPDLPLEPIRIAAMIAVLLAVLLIAAATALRGLGVRTSIVGSPVVVTPSGRFTRVRERTGTLSDDIRDFLRHSR